MNIIILGPQASGKGTQADLLAQKFGFLHLESGKLLRHAAKTNPVVNEVINVKGELFSDQKTMDLIAEEIDKKGRLAKGVIFDGYPRSINQWEILVNWLKSRGEKIDKVILVDISEETTISRLSSRRICEVCGAIYNLLTNPPKVENKCDKCGGGLIQREDDKPETIKKRLSVFRSQTTPLVDLLEKSNFLTRVDGEKSINEIFEDIVNRLGVGNG